MKVNITPDAEKYILENGHAAAVLLSTVSGCCGGAAPIPQIQLNAPRDLSSYDESKIGDITVYINKQIDKEKQINISFGRLLWLKKLSVEII